MSFVNIFNFLSHFSLNTIEQLQLAQAKVFVKLPQRSGECQVVGLTSFATFKMGCIAACDSTGALSWPSQYTNNKYITFWAEIFQNQAEGVSRTTRL